MTKRTFLFSLLVSLIACTGGNSGGCGGCSDLAVTPYPNPAPTGGQIQADVIRAHLPQHLLDFIENHLDNLLNPLLTIENGQAKFLLDESVIPADSPIQFRDGSYFSFDVANLNSAIDLQFIPSASEEASSETTLPSGIRLSINELELFANMTIALTESGTNLIPEAACHIQSLGNEPAIRIHNIAFDLLVGTQGSGAESQLTVTPTDIEFNFGTDSQEPIIAIDITPCDGTASSSCDDPVCQAADANCGEVCGVLDMASELGDFFLASLDPIMEQLETTLATTLGGFISEALQEVPLGIETGIDVSSLAGPIFTGSAPLLIKAEASQTLGVVGSGPGRGFNMGINGGITPQSPALCALGATPPNLSELQGSPPNFPSFIELLDENGTSHLSSYHAVLSASSALLQQASWSAFNGGLLCLGLGTEEIDAISGGAFTFNSGLLINFDAQLLGVAEVDAPMLMRFTAQEQPQIRIGQGQFIAEDVYEPLLELTINDLNIDFHMLIDESQLRVVGLVSDIAVKLDLERVNDNQIQLVIKDIAVANTRQTYSELAPNADLTSLFEFIISFAVNNLLGDDLAFDLDFSETISDTLGIPVDFKIATIRRDEGASGVPYLSVYAKMCSESDTANPLDFVCKTSQNGGLAIAPTPQPELDPQNSFYQQHPSFQSAHPRWVAQTTGFARFNLHPNDNREFQFRVDNGAWSSFQHPHNGQLEIYSPTLKIMGHHLIELRGKTPLRPDTLETAGSYAALIDPERPLLELHITQDAITFHVEELVSPDSVEIRYRTSFENGYTPWMNANWNLPTAGLTGEIQVIATDISGNESFIQSVYLEESLAHNPSTGLNSHLSKPPSLTASGCSAIHAPWFTLLCLGAFGYQRRNRSRRRA